MDLKKILLQEQNAGQTYTVRSEVVSFENSFDKTFPELAIYKGAVFTKEGDNLVAKTSYNFKDTLSGQVSKIPELFGDKAMDPSQTKLFTYKGNVYYNCKSGKFTAPEKSKFSYFAEDSPAPELVRELRKMCGGSSTETTNKNIKDPKWKQYPCITSLKNITINNRPDGTQSISTKKGFTFFNNGRYTKGDKMANYYCDGNKIVWKKRGGGNESDNCEAFPIKFGCKTQKLIPFQKCIGAKQTAVFDDQTYRKIVDYFVSRMDKTTIHGGHIVMANRYKFEGLESEFYNQIINNCKKSSNINTTEYIKKTQKLLGMEPTGQYTEGQVLTIFNNLGGQTPTFPPGLTEELTKIKSVMKFLLKEQPIAQPNQTQNPIVGPDSGPIQPNELKLQQTQQGGLQGGEVLDKIITNKEKSPALTSLQNLLTGKYNKPLDPDGLIGPKTAKAIYDVVSVNK